MTDIIGADSCENCKFMQIDKTAQKCCHRYPPQVHPVIAMTPAGPQLVGDVSMFRKVQSNQWCGEHRRKLVVVAGTDIDVNG